MDNARRDLSERAEVQEPVEILRAKYLDYCSARVTEALLSLSPDEVYVFAQDAAVESGRSEEEELTYGDIVALATLRISRTIDLPSFEEWRKAYQEDPARFEEDLLGLWEGDVRSKPAAEG